MRCSKCQDQLYEYFDGTLTPSMCKSVQEHLAQCPDCHAVFEQERQFSKSMTDLFEQQTRDLRLAPQIRQNVMACPALSGVVAGGADPGPASARPATVKSCPSADGPNLISIFSRSPLEFMKIAAVIAILLAGFYMGNTLWQKRDTEIRTKLEKGTDWRYILVSSRTCYFLNRPELQLMQ